jgi:hypothetical protein
MSAICSRCVHVCVNLQRVSVCFCVYVRLQYVSEVMVVEGEGSSDDKEEMGLIQS